MASNTKITKFRRKRKFRASGAKRRAHNEKYGTTPAFPIHTPEADANAPLEQLSAAARTARQQADS